MKPSPTADPVSLPANPASVADVHIVIVHHRGYALLEKSLSCVLDSQGVSVRLIVVANECSEKLPDLVHREPRILLVRSPQSLGFSEANNLGVQRGREEFGEAAALLFLNNDAFTSRSAIGRLVEVLATREEIGIVGPLLRIAGAPTVLNSLGLNLTENGEAWDEGIGRPESEYGDLPDIREVVAVTGAALMIRTSLLEALGGWTELYRFYYEDIDLCLKARAQGYRVACVTNAEMQHAISATASLGSDFKLTLTWRNRLLLLAIHWPALLLLRILPRLLASEAWLWCKRRRVRAHHDASLQAKAWRQACAALPAALGLRKSRGQSSDWTQLLHPRGSVPTITLPETAGQGIDSPAEEVRP